MNFAFQEMNVLNAIVRDVFYGLPKLPAPPYHMTKEVEDFEGVLFQYTKENGLVAHHPWIIKINQLRNLSKLYHGNLSNTSCLCNYVCLDLFC